MNETIIAKLVQTVVPEPCFTKIFTDFELFNVDCLKIIISKCLGYSIILGSILVKLPQIIKIMQAGSGKGISMLSCVFELLAISANAAYGYQHGFPFSAYGEGVFLGIQSAIVIVLVLLYGGRTLGGILFVLLYTATMGFLISPMAPKELIAAMQGANIIIVMASKLIQAYANYSNGGTGQLSGITVFMLWAGSLARIFTSIQETGDTMTVVTYMAAFSCNCVLVSQMVYYSKKSKTE
ncbi:mannose-P-dolichol utilization defect 1 protein-like [Mya arenaria]|uniref:mannose-P-dolichol utilization defect 1 protein-like n=1 Tax=Mya arenaria TaxID=6604 RepID=UPI0022E57BEA|nr:mannose-P-dolichol utilization defect 1 protein-like [Mya arenaria]